MTLLFAVAQHMYGNGAQGSMPHAKALLRLAAGITSHASRLANQAERRLEATELRVATAPTDTAPLRPLDIDNLPLVGFTITVFHFFEDVYMYVISHRMYSHNCRVYTSYVYACTSVCHEKVCMNTRS